MSAHHIGIKKAAKFSRKSGMNFIGGLSHSGTTIYTLLADDQKLYYYNRLTNEYSLVPEDTKYYDVYVRSIQYKLKLFEL